jgi:hypothetical protein
MSEIPHADWPEGETIVIQVQGGPEDGAWKSFTDEPPDRKYCLDITESGGKQWTECYELDSYGSFMQDNDGDLRPVMVLYYKYAGRREVERVEDDGGVVVTTKPNKTRKKKKNK